MKSKDGEDVDESFSFMLCTSYMILNCFFFLDCDEPRREKTWDIQARNLGWGFGSII